MKKKDLILAGGILLLAGLLALGLYLPETGKRKSFKNHGGRRSLWNLCAQQKSDNTN